MSNWSDHQDYDDNDDEINEWVEEYVRAALIVISVIAFVTIVYGLYLAITGG